jgi:hypothetical protein
MNEKVLITNKTALQQKYGSGFGKIQTAVKHLIAADKARGLNTRLIAVDDPQDMQGVNGKPVTDVTSSRQNKNAVDAIYKAIAADSCRRLLKTKRAPLLGSSPKLVLTIP